MSYRPPDVDPDVVAGLMLHLAPHSVALIESYADADFLAAVAVGESLGEVPSFTRRRVAARIWGRACAYRANRAAVAAVAACLGLATVADVTPLPANGAPA